MEKIPKAHFLMFLVIRKTGGLFHLLCTIINGKTKFASSLSSVMMTVVEALKPKGNTAFITILEHMDFLFISVLAQTPQLEDTAI